MRFRKNVTSEIVNMKTWGCLILGAGLPKATCKLIRVSDIGAALCCAVAANRGKARMICTNSGRKRGISHTFMACSGITPDWWPKLGEASAGVPGRELRWAPSRYGWYAAVGAVRAVGMRPVSGDKALLRLSARLASKPKGAWLLRRGFDAFLSFSKAFA